MLSSQRRRVEVDWAAINEQLPIGRDARSKAARHSLFQSFDPNGNGILSLAEVDKGLTQVLHIHGISNCRLVINRAFHAARDIAPPVASFSSDYIDKNEFRVFMVYLTYYLQLFEYFDRIDTSGDGRVGVREFQAALPLLHRWGLKEATQWEGNVFAAFRLIDKNGGGKVLFAEFADFCLRRGIRPMIGDEQEERKDALDMLQKKRPNVPTRNLRFTAVGQDSLSPRRPRAIENTQKFESPPRPKVTEIQRGIDDPAIIGQEATSWYTSYSLQFATDPQGGSPRRWQLGASATTSPRKVDAASRALPWRSSLVTAEAKKMHLQELAYQTPDANFINLDRHALQAKLHSEVEKGMINTDQLKQMLSAAEQPVSKGRMKALSVAINYTGMRGELKGCVNDQDTICDLWKGNFKVPPEAIRTLRDDDERSMPTKQNILEGLRWLAQDAQPGDMLFFHYSGHGGQTKDSSGDERDGKDETLIPVDYQKSGMIKDDELRQTLVLPLPEGVSLLGLLDCCHSGSGMDLPFVVKLGDDGSSVHMTKKERQYINGSSGADVVMISGCKDDQTSADAHIGTEFSGAMTAAFHDSVKKQPGLSFHHLLQHMRNYLQQNGYTQVPQMSSEKMLNLSDPVIPPR